LREQHPESAAGPSNDRESPRTLYEDVMSKYTLEPFERLAVLTAALDARKRGVLAAASQLLSGGDTNQGAAMESLEEALKMAGADIPARADVVRAFVDLNMALRHPRRTPYPLIRTELDPVVEQLRRRM
jgi:hypothetical protein